MNYGKKAEVKTKAILKAAEKFVIDNSPGILTGLGVTGAVTTAVLTGRASWNSAVLISDAEAERGVKESNFVPLTGKEKLELVWKEFIPPAAVGLVTITAIIAANSVGTRRTAAITAAFKLSEQVNQDYKKKVLDTLGLQKEEKLRSEIAAEKMAKNPPPEGMLIISGTNVLFFDEMTGRYFENTMEKVQQAVNEINYQINQYNHASLTDFYWKIGLQPTAWSDGVGWCLDELLEVQYSPVMYEGKPAIMIGYNSEPIKGFDRIQ